MNLRLIQDLLSNFNILLIDDNIDIANIVKISLEIDGFNVSMFNDPYLALEHFKSNLKRFSVVISDVRMPGINGPELVAIIKDLRPEIKVIFMTAFDMMDIKPEIEKYDYEIAEIFQKPLSMRRLRKIVKEILNNVTVNEKI
jgi:DNA-binding NtrC family response regulator